MMISIIWGLWIAVLLLVILGFTVKIDSIINTISFDVKCTKYTLETYLTKITENEENHDN